MALRALAGIGVSVLLCLMAGAATGQPAKTAAAGAVNLLGQTEEIPGLLKAGKITVAQIPNPHWRADACLTCHRSTPSARDTALLAHASGRGRALFSTAALPRSSDLG